MPFLLSNAVFLPALAALGVPILLHLLLRQRQVRLRFSTVRFFDDVPPRAKSRRRLRNWLLLFLRMACLALVVLAFARPFLPVAAPAGASQRPRRVVVLLDRSLSMQARDASGARWPQAVEAARQALAGLASGDRAALVGLDGDPEVLASMGPPTVALAALKEVQPRSGTASVTDGLGEALRVLGPRMEGIDASIVIVSDLQESSVADLSSVPVPPDVRVLPVAVGERRAANLAVTDVQPEPGGDVPPFVTVANLGDAVVESASVELRLDGALAWARPVRLVAGATTNLDLALPALNAGWHRVEVRVDAADALAADNLRVATFRSPAPLRVLMVEGRTAARSFQRQSFFLGAALAPNQDVAPSLAGRFQVAACAVGDLVERLGDPLANQRPSSDVVLVPAQAEWPAAAVAALERFARMGGGVGLFVDGDVRPAAFHAALDAMLPAEVQAAETAPPDNPWRIGMADRTSPVFDAFKAAGSGNLSVPGFVRRWPLQPAPGSRVLARWEDGLPWLVGHSLGAGRVVLVGFPPDNTACDWPKHKTFVPFVHGLARHLAGRDDDRLVLASPAAVCGTEVSVPIASPRVPSNAKEAGPSSTPSPAFTLAWADGTQSKAFLEESGELRVKASQPGVVRILGPDGSEVHQLAVHPPASESLLSGVTPLQVEQRMDRRDVAPAGVMAAGWLGADPGRREWWRLVLLSALGLLLVETVVANRTKP